MKSISNILNNILQIENGFKHINDGASEIIEIYSKEQCFELALDLFKHEAYQIRMLATNLLGLIATENNDALCFLKENVSVDENWRVQEMLAKAFDEVCKHRGYEVSLPLIEEWLNDNNPNVIRAVTEGLRIWTSRPFFKENPSVAIALIAKHKESESEYLRKSVGNALRDISKRHTELIRQEVKLWDLSNPRILSTYKLTTKLL
jgi:HEAT repeat protein